MRNRRNWVHAGLISVALASIAAVSSAAAQPPMTGDDSGERRLVTGKVLTPQGVQTNVGSFPANIVLSPDGKYVLVTDSGAREYITVLSARDGSVVSQVSFGGRSGVLRRANETLYYGLACGPQVNGITPVYAARGAEGFVSVLSLDQNGMLKRTPTMLQTAVATAPTAPAPDSADEESDAAASLPFVAGLSVSADGSRLFAANNTADPKAGMRGDLRILDAATHALKATVALPGYPYSVLALTAGPNAGRKVYVTSEQQGVVSVVDPDAGKVTREFSTGTQPIGLTLDRAQTRLFVANAGSDTVSIVDTARDKVTKTILLRPDMARGLPGATPTGIALAPDEKRLYVTLADMNAVAVVDLPSGTLAGYIPVGWYPTGAVVSPDGSHLFVANAKGVAARNPNDKPVPGITPRPQYIQNIIEGTVSSIDLTQVRDLTASTAQVIANNKGRKNATADFVNPGIKHVFYIIKENRTYDQVLGDVTTGNGDPSIVLFGRDITPNLHALAERFVLLDNFYCSAEVSGDGWNWSTAGMASEYVARNVPHGYTNHQRAYDYEGTNNGVAVDLLGIPDAAAPPGGYLWDLCLRHKVSFRDYGFFTDDLKLPRKTAEEGTQGLENAPTKKALVGYNDVDFRQFDLTYPDSDAWVKAKIPPSPRQKLAYGSQKDPSRFTAWKREFDAYVKNGNLPAFSMVRFGRDHTSGTSPGASSAQAMVADNDYAVGEFVDAISHSPYWKSSAIFVVEDDAQNGYDHVDAHRSTAYVISPFIRKNSHDSRFYNTDSTLRTIEALLGLPAMTQYDAIAPPIDDFDATASNDAPYLAILPSNAILGQVNGRTAYRAKDSARLLNPLREESAPDEELNDILWHSVKGVGVQAPARHYSLSAPRPVGKGKVDRDGDGDDD